jgi:histidinol dehydrogenase
MRHKKQVELKETKLIAGRKKDRFKKVGLTFQEEQHLYFLQYLYVAVPANIAGCSEIVLCSPPDKKEETSYIICC